MSANRLKARRSRPPLAVFKVDPNGPASRDCHARQKETRLSLNAYNILAVAIGGSLGSVARYLVGIGSGRLLGVSFPWGTLIINVTGSFLIGLFIGLFALRWNLSEPVRVFLTVGICGGYTTFSTFALDTFYLWERGEVSATAAYMLGSVFLSIAGTFSGIYLVRVVS
jgi:fluoride exporter